MQVPQIDIKGIFERAAGHPARLETHTIVCGEKPIPTMDQTHTLNGLPKPASFAVTPSKRREQLFV